MHRKSFRRPSLEQLEAREVLSTFYVATTGNDAAAGTSVSGAWQTLQRAVDSARPGDTVLVESGTYAGCRIGNSGQAGAPITLKADSGARVLVNAPGAKNAHGSDIEMENFSQRVSYWTIQGLEVSNAPTRAGIDLRNTDHITVQDCYIHNNYAWGIFLAFSDHPVITGNHVSYSQTQHGIYDSNSGDYATITNNEVDHNYGCGIQFNGDASQGGKGYMSGNLIAGNVLHDNGAGGGAALNFDGLTDSVIQDNLLYNNLAGGVVLYRGDAATGSTNNVVVNNTITMPSTARPAVNISVGSTGNHLYNNILEELNTGRAGVSIDAGSLAGFVSDYNLFKTSSSFSSNGGSSLISLAQWQAATGQDAHSLSADPSAVFANASGNDYHLAAASPAVDRGTPQQAPAADLDGNPRPSGAGYDIGAYEYVVPGTPPPANQAPAVASPAAASAATVTGTSVGLSVLGADDGGEAGLAYTWAVTAAPAGAPAVSFSASGTNAAKNTTATFGAAGAYTFRVTISDPAGLTATSAVAVAVAQTLTGLSMAPGTAAVVTNGTQQFTLGAADQFGRAIPVPSGVAWSVTSTGAGGTVSSTGLYTAPSSGTPTDTVRASVGGLTATATVTVTGVAAGPVIVDNGGPGFSLTGTGWSKSGKGYGGSLYHDTGTGADTAAWQVTGLTSGLYEVQVTWAPSPKNATNAPYLIYDGNTLLAVVRVNQRLAPSGTTAGGRVFQSLGQFQISSGTLRVVLTDEADGRVNADAVRIVPL